MRKVVLSPSLLLGILICQAPTYALIITGYDPSINDRFSSGYSGDFSSLVPNTDPNFVGLGLDWSGVGWDTDNPQRNVALITPQHFVGADHFRTTGSINFFNQQGVLKTYSVEGFSTLTTTVEMENRLSDLVIGKLTTPIDAADFIAHYPILTLNNQNDYLNSDLLVYGWNARIGTNTLDGFEIIESTSRTSLTFGFDVDGITGEAYGQGGDSGSPSFISYNGGLTVLGTHFAVDDPINTTQTYDSFIPEYLDQITSIVEADGQRLTLIPESARAAQLIGFFIGLTLLFKNRLRRR